MTLVLVIGAARSETSCREHTDNLPRSRASLLTEVSVSRSSLASPTDTEQRRLISVDAERHCFLCRVTLGGKLAFLWVSGENRTELGPWSRTEEVQRLGM